MCLTFVMPGVNYPGCPPPPRSSPSVRSGFLNIFKLNFDHKITIFLFVVKP